MILSTYKITSILHYLKFWAPSPGSQFWIYIQVNIKTEFYDLETLCQNLDSTLCANGSFKGWYKKVMSMLKNSEIHKFQSVVSNEGGEGYTKIPDMGRSWCGEKGCRRYLHPFYLLESSIKWHLFCIYWYLWIRAPTLSPGTTIFKLGTNFYQGWI